MFSLVSRLPRPNRISHLIRSIAAINTETVNADDTTLLCRLKTDFMAQSMRALSLTISSRAADTSSESCDRWWETKDRPLATDQQWQEQRWLTKFHHDGPWTRAKRRQPLDKKPQMKGIVLKTLIKKPKKPNSANRKCVMVRLTNGKETVAFVPGEGHNLQEHSVVLVQTKRVRDVPGLKLRVIRGALDCAHVVKKTQS